MSEEQEALHEQMEREYITNQNRLSAKRTQRALDNALQRDTMWSYSSNQGILIAERTGSSGNQKINERGVPSRTTYQGVSYNTIDDSFPNLYQANSLAMNPATRMWLEYNLMHPPRADKTADIARANSLGR